MTRRLKLLVAAALLLSLSSCGTLGRSIQSLGRTFSNATGSSPQVIR